MQTKNDLCSSFDAFKCKREEEETNNNNNNKYTCTQIDAFMHVNVSTLLYDTVWFYAIQLKKRKNKTKLRVISKHCESGTDWPTGDDVYYEIKREEKKRNKRKKKIYSARMRRQVSTIRIPRFFFLIFFYISFL